jgi:drug/metabolite transporter (DMT)-like permease
VATIGVAVIFAGQMTAAVSIWPMIGLVTATICGAFGALMLKRGPRQPSLFANGIGSAVGLVVGLTVSLIAREPHEIPRRMDQIGPILYLTIASSVVAFGLFAWLVNHWDVTRISFVSVITPIVALTLGAIVRHEPLSAASLLGSALVIVGVVLRIQADRGPTRARAAGG